jgi:hypothetical protein
MFNRLIFVKKVPSLIGLKEILIINNVLKIFRVSNWSELFLL